MPRRLTSGGAIGAALVAAVAAFLVATLLAELVLSRVSRNARDIAGNAGPAITYLSMLRTRLHQFGAHLDQLMERPPPVAAADAVRVRERYEDVRALWRDYRGQDAYPGEQALWPLIDADMAELGGLTEAVIRAAQGGAPRRARALLARAGQITPHMDTLLNGLGQINAQAISRLAADIERVWRDQVALTVVMHIVAVLLALVAGLLAFRAVRSYEILLEARATELEQFAGRISHDLLNPIAAGTTALDFLGGACDDPRSQRIAEAGRRGLVRAREIADALLTFAVAGGRAGSDERARVGDVLRAVVDELAPQARERGIELSLEPGPEAAAACSPGLLSSAIGNLVGNAIKYMNEVADRRVTVRSWVSGRSACVEVADTGPGLTPETAARIFDPFVRASRGGPGVGLGLATVKRIADAHRGRIEVHSSPGQGSRFVLALPLARR
ncbi:MAG TPA: HAMP domain-containing sensor histidine kinase [Kofleriaceae bacterium]|nr:HAMP domain-containing sensor histidine kinase [Kofleriaceae bacterium]